MASRNQLTAPLLQAGAVPDAARAAARDSRLPAAASDRRRQRDDNWGVERDDERVHILTMMLAHVNSSLLDAQRTLQQRSAVLAQYDAALSRLRGPRRRGISRDDLERLPLERIAGEDIEAPAELRPIRIVDDSEFAADWMVCAGDDPEPEAQRMPSGDDTALVELLQRHFQAESRKRQIGRGHVEAALELARELARHPAKKPKRDGAWWKSFDVPEGGARTRSANDYAPRIRDMLERGRLPSSATTAAAAPATASSSAAASATSSAVNPASASASIGADGAIHVTASAAHAGFASAAASTSSSRQASAKAHGKQPAIPRATSTASASSSRHAAPNVEPPLPIATAPAANMQPTAPSPPPPPPPPPREEPSLSADANSAPFSSSKYEAERDNTVVGNSRTLLNLAQKALRDAEAEGKPEALVAWLRQEQAKAEAQLDTAIHQHERAVAFVANPADAMHVELSVADATAPTGQLDASVSAPLAQPVLQPPPGRVPRVVGGAHDGKPCWWDGAAQPSGCWREPDGRPHVVMRNAQRTADRAAAREQRAAMEAERARIQCWRAEAARLIQTVVRAWQKAARERRAAQAKAAREQQMEAARRIQRFVRARRHARREAARKAAEAQRAAKRRVYSQQRRAIERMECQRLGKEWRSTKEGSDDLGIVLADSKVYLEEMPSLADQYAMLRHVRMAQGCAPSWDPERCRFYLNEGDELNACQAWLPVDAIERWYHQNSYDVIDNTYMSCWHHTLKPPPVITRMCDLRGHDPWGSCVSAKQREVQRWAEARPAKVKAEEAVEDAAHYVQYIRNGGWHGHASSADLEEAEATLAEAISRCERADEIEAEQNAEREAKAAEAAGAYKAHLAIVRERHPHIVRAVERGGKEALVRLCKANALVYTGTNAELIARLANADVHGCASQCDGRGRAGRCPQCASKLRLVCSPSVWQPNEAIRLECPQWRWQKGGRVYGGSFKPCGWKVTITPENKSEVLSVRMKDSWERDLFPLLPV